LVAAIGAKKFAENFHELDALVQVVDATENGQSTARSIAPEFAVTSNFEEVLNNPEIKRIALAFLNYLKSNHYYSIKFLTCL
jgi:hypothetical protein